jgi:hypothetical protein
MTPPAYRDFAKILICLRNWELTKMRDSCQIACFFIRMPNYYTACFTNYQSKVNTKDEESIQTSCTKTQARTMLSVLKSKRVN